jgi:hypothetical protein
MVFFQTKNIPIWVLAMLVYFMDIWSILRPIGSFCAQYIYFVVIWYIFPHFSMLYEEKFRNLAQHPIIQTFKSKLFFLLKATLAGFDFAALNSAVGD